MSQNQQKTTALVRNAGGLKKLCDQLAPKIAEVLPRHLTPERIMKTALIAASKNPQLYQCTEGSLARSIMSASELGLDCSGTLGSAYLVPYGREATLIIGYRGLIDLARRSGKIRSIEARIVYENDEFDLDFGDAMKPIKHRPQLRGDRGEPFLVYARARLADQDEPQVEVMTVDEVNRIRDRSRAAKNGPWVTDWGEMARKTVVRRLAKYLPLSPEVERAFQVEDEGPAGLDTAGGRQTLVTVGEPEPATPEAFADDEPEPEPEPAPEPEVATPADDPGDDDTPLTDAPGEPETPAKAHLTPSQGKALGISEDEAEQAGGWDAAYFDEFDRRPNLSASGILYHDDRALDRYGRTVNTEDPK